MKIGVNQFSFPTSYDVAAAIKAAARLGYEAIEVCFTDAGSVSAGGVTDALDISSYHNRLFNVSSTEKDARELKKIAEDNGIAIDSVGGIVSFSIHPLTSTDEKVAEKCRDAMKKMLDCAGEMGAGTVMVIPGMVTEDMNYEDAFKRAQERMAALCDYAPDLTLAIENVWNNYLYSPMELNSFVDGTGKDNLGIYFDVANARRFGYPQQWIHTMGGRIKALHLKDYRMSVDNINGFTNLLDGDVNYPAVAKAISDIGFAGNANVELIPPAHYQVEETLRYARQAAQLIFNKDKQEEQK